MTCHASETFVPTWNSSICFSAKSNLSEGPACSYYKYTEVSNQLLLLTKARDFGLESFCTTGVAKNGKGFTTTLPWLYFNLASRLCTKTVNCVQYSLHYNYGRKRLLARQHSMMLDHSPPTTPLHTRAPCKTPESQCEIEWWPNTMCAHTLCC